MSLSRLALQRFATVKPLTSTISPYTGPSYEKVLSDRQKHVHPLYVPYYKEPLLIVEGKGNFLFDYRGRPYLDLISGIATTSVGHSHPRIVSVVQDQIQKLLHIAQVNMHPYQGQYSRMLAQKCGGKLDTVFLCNSGGEANDFAFLMARLFTKQQKIVSVRNGYHGVVGNSAGATNVGVWNQPTIRGHDHITLSYPSPYRGVHGSNVDGYIREAQEVLDTTTSGAVAAAIFEPVLGVGGAVPTPDGYLKKIYQVIRKRGGLIISDEVQTGFGRIGKDFWGYKHYGVQPDIVTMAKGIGGGFPMAAVVTTREIALAMKKNFFNTFGGGPLQCRVGMEVLRIIEDERLHENAEIVGEHIRNRLRNIQQNCRIVGDVRGKGLLNGLEVVKDKRTKEPAVEEAVKIMEMCKERGILISKGGPLGNVFRIIPSLTMSIDEANLACDNIEQVLKSFN